MFRIVLFYNNVYMYFGNKIQSRIWKVETHDVHFILFVFKYIGERGTSNYD